MEVVLLVLLLLNYSDSLKIYQSTIQIPDQQVSGLHFINEQYQVYFSNSFTICERLHYMRMAKFNRQAIILYIPNYQSSRPFLSLSAEYLGNWFHLGLYPHAYSNWIIRELPDNYNIWSSNQWHHVCLAFNKLYSSIALVKVITYLHTLTCIKNW